MADRQLDFIQYWSNIEIAEKLSSDYFVSQPPLQFLNIGNPGLGYPDGYPKPGIPTFQSGSMEHDFWDTEASEY